MFVEEDSIIEQSTKKSTSLNILLVEDNPKDARRLRELLAEESTFGFELREVASMSAAESYLTVERFDVIVLDPSLPDSSGLEAYERARISAPQTPILVLTLPGSDPLAGNSLKEDAAGYFVKGEGNTKGFIESIHAVVHRNGELSSVQGTLREK